MQKQQQIILLFLSIIIKCIAGQILNEAIKSFAVEEVKVDKSPFCIVRHHNVSVWNDYYISYNKTIRTMIIQKNNDPPQYISNFQEHERFMLCYLSTVVENQITIVSLNHNFTQPGIQLPIQGYMFSFLGGETQWSVQTEYQYNITSGFMKNAGYPRRATNDSNYEIVFSTQYGVFDKSSGNEIDYRQYGLSPIPNYDETCLIYYNQQMRSTFIPNGYFFQYSNAYNQLYAQQFNAQSGGGGFATFRPLIDEQYSILTVSTVNVANDTFKMVASKSQIKDGVIYIFNLDKLLCIQFQDDVIQQINDIYLLITHNQDSFIIRRDQFFTFFEMKINYEERNNTYCYFKNYTSEDQYYYHLGQFNIHPKDWLGVIELKDEDSGKSNYLLTTSVFDTDNATLLNYDFYSIDLEKKTKPVKLDTSSFNKIEGYYFYEGFTYYRGIPFQLTFDKLNRFALLYLVKDTSILKLQFIIANNLQNNNNFLFSGGGIILNTLLVCFDIGLILSYLDLKKERRLVKERIGRLKKITYIQNGSYQNQNLGFIINYMKGIKMIHVLDEDKVIYWDVIPNNDDQIILPNNYNLMKMETDELEFYAVKIDSTKCQLCWDFIKRIKEKQYNDKFNQIHYIFSQIKYAVELQQELDNETFHKFLFAIEKGKSSLQNLKNLASYINNKKTAIEEDEVINEDNENDYDDEYDDDNYNKKKVSILTSPQAHKIENSKEDAYSPELIIMRKFTLALLHLKNIKHLIPQIQSIQENIYQINKTDLLINPLIFFYSLQFDLTDQTLDQIDRNSLDLTEQYIRYLNLTESLRICPKWERFDTFRECVQYFSFYLDMNEYTDRFEDKDILLGEGGYGEVKQIKDKLTDEIFAVKIQSIMKNKEILMAQGEFNTLKNISLLNEDCATKFYYGIIDNSIQNETILFNRSFFIMQKAEKNLKKEIEDRKKQNHRVFENEEVTRMFIDLCSHLHIIHTKRQYIHGDISLDNILKISSMVYKFSDFGSANEVKLLNQSSTYNFQYKELYLNPEMLEQLQLLRQNKRTKYQVLSNMELRRKNDYYALGLVFYQVVTLDFLFQPFITKEACQNNIIQMNEQLLQYQNYSPHLIKGIQSLLNSENINTISKEFIKNERKLAQVSI